MSMHTHQRYGALKVFGPEPGVAFTVLDFVGDDGERQPLNACQRVFACRAIGEDAGKLGYGRDQRKESERR